MEAALYITHVGVLFHTVKGQVTVKPFYPNSVLVQIITVYA